MNLQNSAYNKNETQGFNVEATFKGQKALTFMKNMGYEFKPVQQTIYEKTSEAWAPGPGSHSFTFLLGEIDKITEKSMYLKNNMKEINRYPLTEIKRDPTYLPFIIEEIARYKINYTDNVYLKTSLFLNKIMKEMRGTHDYRRVWEYNSWKDYYGNNKLIREFQNNYPDEE